MDTSETLRILFVEDIPEDAEIAARELRKAGFAFVERRVDNRETFLAALEEFAPNIIVSDYSMPRFDGMRALQLAQERVPELPFIVVTGSKNEETAVQCLKAGAADYVIKSHIFRLPYALRDALEHARIRTEKEAASRALKESEENYRTLADSGQALIWTADAERSYTYFNKPWLEFTGRSFEQEAGDGWMDGVHPEDLTGYRAVYDAAFTARQKFSLEFRLRRADGIYRWVQNDGSPRLTGDGRFLGYIGHCLDISERKTAEQQLRLTLAERETLLRELFHRTRNNMQVIMAILALQEEITDSDQARQMSRDTSERIMSMSLVHKKLYDSQDLSSIDLAEYIGDLLQLLIYDSTFPGHRIDIETDLEPVEVSIDTAMPFGLILYELLSNAFRHAFPADAAGTVRIGLKALPDLRVELTVSDDGVGLPAQYSLPGKSGLGFQLIYGLVQEQLRGTVDIDSRSGLACRVNFPNVQTMKRV
jgi:PAS domain S-box-containing protein